MGNTDCMKEAIGGYRGDGGEAGKITIHIYRRLLCWLRGRVGRGSIFL